MRLNEEQKRFVVRCHAEGLSYPMIEEEFLARYNEELPRPQVAYYDPGNSSGGGPHKRLKKLYDELREDLAQRIAELPIASPYYQLRQLQRVVDRHAAGDRDTSDANVVLNAIKLAAELRGDIVKTLKIDGDIEVTHRTRGYTPEEMTDEQYRAILQSLPTPRGFLPPPRDELPAGANGRGEGEPARVDSHPSKNGR